MNEASLKQSRILIIDDDVSHSALLVNILNRMGFDAVKSLGDPLQIFEVVPVFNPELVIVDLLMPHLDGFQVIEQLTTLLPGDVFVPVIVLTGDASPKNKNRALMSGAAHLMGKPVDSCELLMRIRVLLRARYLQLQLHQQNLALQTKVIARTNDLENALAELNTTQEHMAQQDRLRPFAEMASGIVHDFNNALMSVTGYSDLLLNDPEIKNGNETLSDYLNIIHSAGRDASSIASRLREFCSGRKDGGGIRAFDLNKIVEQAVELTKPKWKGQALAQGIKIQLELKLEKLPPMEGNPDDFRDALTRLIFNAVDALPHGGTISIESHATPNSIGLSVTDNGIGMTEEVRTQCVNPQFTTKGSGGISLSIVEKIALHHGGELKIQSQPGKGSTFTMILRTGADLEEESDSKSPAFDRPLKVLVVDDEVQSLDIVAKFLTSDGHIGVKVSSPQEAVNRFAWDSFDLVVTDQAMPGITGCNLAAALKHMRKGQPVILLTGLAEPVDSQSCEADYVLHKPLSRGSLRQAIMEVMQPAALSKV